MVCEATATPQTWALPQFCGSAFAFGLESQLVDAAKAKPEAVRAVARYFDTAPAGMATFVSNHDSFTGGRLWDHLGGDNAQIRLAAATYLLLPGTPFIYYGEELGMAGAADLVDDPKVRAPMSWTADATSGGGFTSGTKPFRPAAANVSTHNVAAESADVGSLLSFYKAMLALRNGIPALSKGDYRSLWISDQAFAYLRQVDGEQALVLINYATTPTVAPLQGLVAGSRFAPAYPAQTESFVTVDASGAAQIALGAQSLRVFTALKKP
jgi:glycosidase